MRKLLSAIFFLLCGTVSLSAQGLPRAADFTEQCDTLTARCERRFGVKGLVKLEKVMLRDGELDLYFGRGLSDYPWHAEDVRWFVVEFAAEGESQLGEYKIGRFMASGCHLEELATPLLTRNGKSPEFAYADKTPARMPLVRRSGARHLTRGLEGRHIALWQSHGYYFDDDKGFWRWQRSALHRTVEDLYTQSYVLDYVIPMLENAGAVVMCPRERDTQRQEVVCDNDSTFVRVPKGAPLRVAGTYQEHGRWEDGGTGFADLKQEYEVTDNPFTMGTARTAWCSVTPSASAVWTPAIPQRGRYAVYVSYASLPKSSRAARYTVHHLGGDSEFLVDQRRGGGTWIYLGTFEFAPGCSHSVELDNKGNAGECVSADAVRFGGGMGKIAREGILSGMPSYIEGASYWIPWAGGDSTLRAWESDYVIDYAIRGAWVKMLRKQKDIPFDCSIALHSDAGVMQGDSIVGTLSIYTLKADNSRRFTDGSDRMTCRTFADFVQTQVVEDIRTGFEPQWTRRAIWNRSYSESRTTDVPAMLLEVLSHQNFADMRYGLDPSFRFLVGRAVYKGILKYLACKAGASYTVQPLPVHAFSARLTGAREVLLSWEPTRDPLEPTATPRGYTLYTRIDDGAFDEGVPILDTEAEFEIEPGHLYSYKIEAWNDGGLSFPSEVLAVGVPAESKGPAVLVVNNFDRVAAPAWIDKDDYAGFESRLDEGMPYMRDLTYAGENYEFRRPMEWESDFAPGFGASYSDKAGLQVAGNTFDYPAVHGRSILALGLPFCSASAEAFASDSTYIHDFRTLDLICGAQVTTKSGGGSYPARFQVFPGPLREALRRWTSEGGNVLISGSNIATDVWSSVYDIDTDTPERDSVKVFVHNVLGYGWAGSSGTNSGEVGGMSFYHQLNEECYSCTHPDGVAPGNVLGSVWMRYSPSGVPAGVLYEGDTHKVASLGVPIECLVNAQDRQRVLREAFRFFGLFDDHPVASARFQYGFYYFGASC